MDAVNFCYWLQGYFELNKVDGGVKLSQDQINMIGDHLDLVFGKQVKLKFESSKDIKQSIEDIGKYEETIFCQYKHPISC